MQAASKDAVWVTIGGTIGHAICTGLAVVGGRLVASRYVCHVTMPAYFHIKIFAYTHSYCNSLHFHDQTPASADANHIQLTRPQATIFSCAMMPVAVVTVVTCMLMRDTLVLINLAVCVRRISEKTVTLCGGSLFLVFALHGALTVRASRKHAYCQRTHEQMYSCFQHFLVRVGSADLKPFALSPVCV